MRFNRRNFITSGVLFAGGFLSGSVFWRDVYKYTSVEIKCWVQINEREGYETVPLVKLNNSNWFYAAGFDNPLRLDSRYEYVIEAPAEFQGARFVSWQSEKTGMIIPDTKLRLPNGFESDTWWQNYVKDT